MRFWYWDVCGTCKARIPDSEIPVDVREWSRFHGKQLVQDLLKHPEQRMKMGTSQQRVKKMLFLFEKSLLKHQKQRMKMERFFGNR